MAIAAVRVRFPSRVPIFQMIVDLRSDTVTKPDAAMLDRMLSAAVGDDVFKEDPTVIELQDLAADMFGMEAALFCPSGSMTNQIAIKLHTRPGDEVICEAGAHVHYYEGGGIAFNSGATTNAIIGNRGVITADQIRAMLRPKNVHFPTTSLVCLENTCNRGGGKVFGLENINEIRTLCLEYDLKLHLDGARLFNSIVHENSNPRAYGKLFDSISICLSKGLGAPVGSLLLSSNKDIAHAVRIRKVFGGGMRQAGYLAAAGIYALKHNIASLAKDHEMAKALALELSTSHAVNSILPVETNIIVFELKENMSTAHFLGHLLKHDIKAFEVGAQSIRFVTHRCLPNDTVARVASALQNFPN